MGDAPGDCGLIADALIAELRRRVERSAAPFVVAVDGRSGAGKSTFASVVARTIGATVVPCDDFFAASVTDAEWDRRSPAERAATAVDWRRLRADAIEPLRAGRPARWFAFDFVAGPGRDGTYPLQRSPTERSAGRLIVLDGAYSSAPELGDVLDFTVLAVAPDHLRRQRLITREEPLTLARWESRWGRAEDHYFDQVRPRASFDAVVATDRAAMSGIAR